MEISLEIIITSIVAPIIPTLVTYFFTRKKVKADVQSKEFSNIELYRGATNKLIKDLSTQIDQLLEDNSSLREKVEGLSSEIKQMKNTYPCTDCPGIKKI